MTTLDIILLSAVLAFILFLSAYVYIRKSYREFCLREDRLERIDLLKREINSARQYVSDHYSSPEDNTVQMNLIPKIDFLLKLISNKTPDIQEQELKTLLDMLTETFVRLKTNYDDVTYILSPLNNFRDRLVHEHLDWLKDHMDEDELL